MNKVKWFFGYRCEVCPSCVREGYWIGVVYAPMWHPARSLGMDDLFVLKITDEWIIAIDEYDSFYMTSNACWRVASTLRRMQDDWDRLSPYEREYRIW